MFLFVCKCVQIIVIIQIEETDTDADMKSGWVLDNFPRTNSQMQDLQQSGILPDSLFCLSDPDENYGVRLKTIIHPMYSINFSSTEVSFQCLEQFLKDCMS